MNREDYEVVVSCVCGISRVINLSEFHFMIGPMNKPADMDTASSVPAFIHIPDLYCANCFSRATISLIRECVRG